MRDFFRTIYPWLHTRNSTTQPSYLVQQPTRPQPRWMMDVVSSSPTTAASAYARKLIKSLKPQGGGDDAGCGEKRLMTYWQPSTNATNRGGLFVSVLTNQLFLLFRMTTKLRVQVTALSRCSATQSETLSPREHIYFFSVSHVCFTCKLLLTMGTAMVMGQNALGVACKRFLRSILNRDAK